MKKFLILTIAGIILVPLSGVLPIKGTAVWNAQFIGLLFLLFLGVAIFLWDYNKCLSIFFGSCVLSTFFVAGMSSRAITLLYQISFCLLASYGISKFTKGYRKAILYTIAGLIFVQFSWLVMQAYNLDPFFDSIYDGSRDELVGFSGATGQLGAFFAITLPVALYVFPPVALLNVVGLMIAKSSFAFVAGFVSSLFYIWFVSKKLFAIFLIIGIVSGGIFFLKVEKLTDWDFDTRLSVWKYATKMSMSGSVEIEKGKKAEVVWNSILGCGFGNFPRIFPYIPQKPRFNLPREKFTHAHNDPIEFFAELGHAAKVILFLILGNMLLIFKKSQKSREMVVCSACLLAVFLNSLGNFIFHIAVSGMLIVVFLGMFHGIRKEQLNGAEAG